MRFAQILNSKVHWIFEADEKPNFASNIILVDITGNNEVQEGWDYDLVTGEFIKPIIPPPTSKPSESEELANYVLEVDFRVVMLEMGL